MKLQGFQEEAHRFRDLDDAALTQAQAPTFQAVCCECEWLYTATMAEWAMFNAREHRDARRHDVHLRAGEHVGVHFGIPSRCALVHDEVG